MTPDQAAWVRDHAWTPAIRTSFNHAPSFWTHPATPYHTVIWRHGGLKPATFEEPFRHPTTADGGTRRRALAMVWTAGPKATQLDLFGAVA